MLTPNDAPNAQRDDANDVAGTKLAFQLCMLFSARRGEQARSLGAPSPLFGSTAADDARLALAAVRQVFSELRPSDLLRRALTFGLGPQWLADLNEAAINVRDWMRAEREAVRTAQGHERTRISRGPRGGGRSSRWAMRFASGSRYQTSRPAALDSPPHLSHPMTLNRATRGELRARLVARRGQIHLRHTATVRARATAPHRDRAIRFAPTRRTSVHGVSTVCTRRIRRHDRAFDSTEFEAEHRDVAEARIRIQHACKDLGAVGREGQETRTAHVRLGDRFRSGRIADVEAPAGGWLHRCFEVARIDDDRVHAIGQHGAEPAAAAPAVASRWPGLLGKGR